MITADYRLSSGNEYTVRYIPQPLAIAHQLSSCPAPSSGGSSWQLTGSQLAGILTGSPAQGKPSEEGSKEKAREKAQKPKLYKEKRGGAWPGEAVPVNNGTGSGVRIIF